MFRKVTGSKDSSIPKAPGLVVARNTVRTGWGGGGGRAAWNSEQKKRVTRGKRPDEDGKFYTKYKILHAPNRFPKQGTEEILQESNK